jgi:hypothetical protein
VNTWNSRYTHAASCVGKMTACAWTKHSECKDPCSAFKRQYATVETPSVLCSWARTCTTCWYQVHTLRLAFRIVIASQNLAKASNSHEAQMKCKKEQHILFSVLCWPAARQCTWTAHGTSERNLLMVCETLGEALAQTQQFESQLQVAKHN